LNLRQAQFTVPGYDMVNQRPAAGVSDTSLLINLYVDETMLKAFREDDHQLSRSDSRETLLRKLVPRLFPVALQSIVGHRRRS